MFCRLLLLLTLFVHIDVSAQVLQKQIRIATVDYPPLMQRQHGLMTEIVKEAFLTQGIEVLYDIYPLSRITWSVVEKFNVAAVGSVNWFNNSEHSQETVFAVPIYYTSMKFFYLNESFPAGIEYNDLSEMNKFLLGYVRGGSLTGLLQSNKLRVSYASNLKANIRQLELGRVELFIATELGGWGAIRKYSYRPVSDYKMVDKEIHSISGDILFPKNQQKLKQEFEAGFKAIVENGTYLDLLQRHYQVVPARLIELGKAQLANPS